MQHRLELIAAACVSLALSGCATTGQTAGDALKTSWTPTVDQRGLNQAAYAKDLGECVAVAEATPNTDAGKRTMKTGMKAGAAAAGLTGVAVVATGGLALLPLAAGAMVANGAVVGAAGAAVGKVSADHKYEQVVTACLTGRGYKVLG